jgi:hypothetical protein
MPGCAVELLSRLGPGTGLAVPRLVDGESELIQSQRREPSVVRAWGDALLGAWRVGRYSALGARAGSNARRPPRRRASRRRGSPPPAPTGTTPRCWHPPWAPRSASSAASCPGSTAATWTPVTTASLPATPWPSWALPAQIAGKSVPAPIQAGRRWPVERTAPRASSMLPAHLFGLLPATQQGTFRASVYDIRPKALRSRPVRAGARRSRCGSRRSGGLQQEAQPLEACPWVRSTLPDRQAQLAGISA